MPLGCFLRREPGEGAQRPWCRAFQVATEMRAATAAVPSQTQQLAEVSGLRWVGETPPAIAIAECEKAEGEGARAEGGERKRKREGCGL